MKLTNELIPVGVHARPPRDRHGLGGEVLDEAVAGLAEGAVAAVEGDGDDLLLPKAPRAAAGPARPGVGAAGAALPGEEGALKLVDGAARAAPAAARAARPGLRTLAGLRGEEPEVILTKLDSLEF